MILKIGDKVAWRHSWGNGPLEDAIIEHITVTDYPREKYGDDRDQADWALVKENRVCVSLENGRWAYGSQISPLGTDPTIWHADAEAHADRLVRFRVAAYEGAHFGDWQCDDSPTKACVYNDLRDPMHDSCIFCDDPEERK